MFVFYCRILPSFHSNWSKVKTSVKHYLTDILQVQFKIIILLGYKCYSLRKHPFLFALRRWACFVRNVPSGEEQGETDVFAGYKSIDTCTVYICTLNCLLSYTSILDSCFDL